MARPPCHLSFFFPASEVAVGAQDDTTMHADQWWFRMTFIPPYMTFHGWMYYSSSSMHILWSLALNVTGARYVTMFSNRFNHWHFHSVSSRNVTTSTQSRLQFTTQYVCNRNQLKQPSGTKEKWGERLKMMNLMPWIQKLTWLQALAHLPDAAESSDTNVAPDLTDFQQICMSYLI